ncbi:protein of unknown function [Xenorhabdus poinarii G6]|uniref:Uncharacterized protein n=1 Tax=Xenorhabdus poinarii G6 TaxID=1354304 RepID=A0A068R0U3_9GAMM|nr:protein of unknown function [Xenorhabdus poinarii G6]
MCCVPLWFSVPVDIFVLNQAINHNFQILGHLPDHGWDRGVPMLFVYTSYS